MKTKPILSDESQVDLKDIKDYITGELHSPKAAINVIRKIKKRIESLSRFPEIGIPLDSVIDIQTNYRLLVCGNYNVIYRVENNRAYVIRILYGKRDYAKILFNEEEKDEALLL
jgi:plasmid stabilization system protein ParE